VNDWIRRLGRPVSRSGSTYALDVTRFDGLAGFVEGVVAEYGRLDVLVNNAGFAVVGFAEDIQLEELRLQFETDFFGASCHDQSRAAYNAAAALGAHYSGVVDRGMHGSVTVSSYSASKHALEGWSESLGMELNALGIKVVLVEPGAFQTDIWTRGAGHGQGGDQRQFTELPAQPARARADREAPKGRSDHGCQKDRGESRRT